ncbi:MAG: class I SAM-dependent methyltransferase [Gammaproteobacteria bacterium SHHR-1]|uniref:class I SAM-dependent methyltransferase n=1 Tax=Magnetovirga frankeli TaxID=947516 RepID=UPI001294150D|nr:class I SAM-dependent methyltransferase [gamma proteobacterium SS-5]
MSSPPSSQAQRADPFALYEASVQCPQAEVEFLQDSFQRLRGRVAHRLREDFCGTGAVSCAWVRQDGRNRALAVDLDPGPLDWARTHHLPRLSADQRTRMQWLQADVRQLGGEGMDLVSAMNFSYWCLHTRPELRAYFAQVRHCLRDHGVFFLDAFGGYDAFRELSEERQVEDVGLSFTYIWQQERYNPVDGRLDCQIHFAFADGSRQERAFSYAWRLWTLPEIQELLLEAGFARVVVYWQGWDENDEADGIFRPVTSADADAGWICYLAALK